VTGAVLLEDCAVVVVVDEGVGGDGNISSEEGDPVDPPSGDKGGGLIGAADKTAGIVGTTPALAVNIGVPDLASGGVVVLVDAVTDIGCGCWSM
jgi:hypothetical protein